MRSLGSIIFTLLMINLSLLADVKATLKSDKIISGDEAVLMIKAAGKSIVFPKIEKIGEYEVTNRYTNTSISYKNGKKSRAYTRKYIFHPLKSLKIKPYKVIVDKKEFLTEPLTLTVTKDPFDDNNTFSFLQIADKKSVYVDEGILLTYIFKHKMNVKLSDASFDAPKFEGFWVKKLKEASKEKDIDSGYFIYTLKYLLYPQRSGVLHIDGAGMDIGVVKHKAKRYYSFQSIRRKVLHSNALDINVSPLPSGVKNFGKFSFSAVADKNKTKANEPVNLTITIRGEGNVDDIDEFKLDIPNAEVYSDKPARMMELKDGKSIVLFKQKFAIVSDRNFTIEPIKFRYFDAITKEVKEPTSKAYKIEVINARSNNDQDQLIKPKEDIKNQKIIIKESKLKWSLMVMIFGFGVLVGSLFTLVYLKLKSKKRAPRTITIEDKIVKSKSDKELLSLLLPYLDRSSKIDSVIKKLEENLYQNKTHKIDKRGISKGFKELLKDDEVEEILRY